MGPSDDEGTGSRALSTAEVEQLAEDFVLAALRAKTAGFDMIYIDMEHSTLTADITGQICLAALSAGIAPMVRVPANTPEYIQRALDGGALGIIAASCFEVIGHPDAALLAA